MATGLQLTRKITRLGSMSRAEVVDRVRQHVTARVDAWRYHRGHVFADTLQADWLKSNGHFFFRPGQLPVLCDLLQQRFPAQVQDIVARAEQISAHRFDLLGYSGLDYGSEINWHLDAVHGKRGPKKSWYKVNYLDFEEVGDSKITWELNRHQHLVILAKAYRLTGDDKYAREIVTQWKHWQAENPYPIGMNWASSLEVAFRSLSWIWVYFLLEDSAAMTVELKTEWVRALALNGRHIETFLSTYFSPNTHLLGEVVALFFIGVLFPGIPRAQRWKQRGWNMVLDVATTQVRKDGFYFEQSTYYHVYALDLFLHARILAIANAIPVPVEFDQTLVGMLDALCVLGRAGVLPSLGDDDGGRVFDPQRNRAEHLIDPLSTGAILFRRGDLKFLAGLPREETLWLLGEKGLREFKELKSIEPHADSVAMRDSGLYLMADAETAQQFTIDAGPHGPGHGHADALSVTLIRNGRVWLMDPGTYEYIGGSGLREQYRGTAAHNTLRVDGLDQADTAGPFAWGGRPIVKEEHWVAGRSFNLFSGSHDGYMRLPEPVRHRRSVFHRKGQFWLVRDVAEGQGSHKLELTWHLGPGLSPLSTKDNVFADGQESLGLITTEANGWSQSAHRGCWSPVYGRAERATVLTFGREADLPAEFVTLMLPDAGIRSGIGRLEQLLSDASVSAYRYIREGQEHQFFFSNGDRAWNYGKCGSDAAFLYCAWEREQELRLLIACGGSYVEVAGQRVLTSESPVDYSEVMSSGAKTEMFSADPERVVLLGSLDRMDLEVAAPGKDPGGKGV
jgi:hypothetical protein